MQMPAEGRRIALIGEIGEKADQKGLHDLCGRYIAARTQILLPLSTGATREEMSFEALRAL